MTALWNGEIIAESSDAIVIENNHYFPPASIHHQYLEERSTYITCGWKGIANYYTIYVKGKQNEDAAWYYSQLKDKATSIND